MSFLFFFRYHEPYGKPFQKAIRVAEEEFSPEESEEWAGSYMAWLLRCLRDSGLPSSHPLVVRALSELEKKQRSDGSWDSQDGEAYAVTATIEVLRVLKDFSKDLNSYSMNRMKEGVVLRKVLSLTIVLTIILCGCQTQKVKQFEWGNLRNLGQNINSAGRDEHVTFPQDGQTMYLASNREGDIGNYDIYVSRFENGEWTKAELLPPPINTKRDEFDVFVTLDGEKMFFASNRHNEDPYWNCDIYVSEWDGESWGDPEIYDSTFVTPGKPDWGAAVPKDFKTFIFSGGREPAQKGSSQIFQSKWLGGMGGLKQRLCRSL